MYCLFNTDGNRKIKQDIMVSEAVTQQKYNHISMAASFCDCKQLLRCHDLMVRLIVRILQTADKLKMTSLSGSAEKCKSAA